MQKELELNWQALSKWLPNDFSGGELYFWS